MPRTTEASLPAKSAEHVMRQLIVALIAIIYLAQLARAQESSKIVVPLQLRSPYVQEISVSHLKFDKSGQNSKTRIGSSRLGKLPGDVRIAVETIPESPNAYNLRIDTNGDNDLSDESAILIKLNSSVTVMVTRKQADGTTESLPYTLSYGRNLNGQQTEETFDWRPNYAAEGKINIGNCHVEVKVLDANGDGIFDRRDFRNMTSINVDDGKAGTIFNLNDPRVIKHSDGSFEIPGELRRSAKRKWFNGNEILEICGVSYQVEQVQPDGSALTLAKTSLRIPRVGEEMPHFTMATLDGRVIDTRTLKGNLTLIDFWATWCGKCVAKFSTVKQITEAHKGRLKVIAVNVDEKSRLPLVHQIIRKYNLTWPHVALGQGKNDVLWKEFGGMSNNGLAVPLYVLVDASGLIRYAGDGEEDLSELRSKITELDH
jgi:thiol-disulfide isomerase/thioredoxin